MPFFFFLSGLCFCIGNNSNTNFKDFALKRAKRLLLPALLASVIVCIIANTTGVYKVDLTKRLPDANWFFLTLFMAQLIYYPMANYCKDTRVAVLILLCFYAASSVMSMNNVKLDFCLACLPSAVCYYGLGNLVRGKILPLVANEKRIKAIFVLGLLLCGVVFLWVVLTHYQYMMCDNSTKYPWAQIVVALLGSAGIIFVSTIKLPNTLMTIAQWIGTNTIVIVGYHLMIVKLASYYIKPLIASHLEYKILEQILIWSICLMLTAFLNKYAHWAVGKR